MPFSLSTQLNVALDIDYGYDAQFRADTTASSSPPSAGSPTQPGQPSELTVSLTATAADLNLHGSIGFFQFTGSPIPSPQPPLPPVPPLPTIQLSAGVQMDVNGASVSKPQLVGNAQVNVHLDANLGSTSPTGVTFPHIETNFEMNWSLADNKVNVNSPTDLGSKPTVEFKDVRFGLGSFLGSMVQPIANVIDEITAPLAPVYALMKAPLPGLSDLSEIAGGGPITVDTLLSAAVKADVLPPDYQLLADLGLRLHSLVELIRSAKFTPENDGLIPLGDFDLSGNKNGDLRTTALNDAGLTFDEWLQDPTDISNLSKLAPVALQASTSVEATIKNNIASLGLLPGVQDQVTRIFNQIDNTLLDAQNGVGLTFPLLDQPLSIFQLVLGQDVDFMKFNFKFSGQASETKTIPVWGPVEAGFSGSINLSLNLDAGVDTYGLRQLLIGIIENPGQTPDFSLLDKSFYVSTAAPLVKIDSSITADAGPKLTFGADGSDFYAEATFNGSIETDPNHPILVKFNDPSKTDGGKLRPIGMSGDLFYVDGKIDAALSFSVSGGFEVGGVKLASATVFSLPIAQKTLFDTSASVSTANPLNQPPPPSSIDVVFNANNFEDEPGGNVLEVEADNGFVDIIYNGVRFPSYLLSSVRTITILGSADVGTFFVVKGDFGGAVPIQIDGGETSNDQLFFDDTGFSGAGSLLYAVHDTELERDLFLPGIPVPIPSTVINFQGIEGVNLDTATNLSSEVHVSDIATQTNIVGGNQGNVFLLGGPGESLSSVLNLLNVTGGQGVTTSLSLTTRPISLPKRMSWGTMNSLLKKTFKAFFEYLRRRALDVFFPQPNALLQQHRRYRD